jgi:hypothetical protein
VDYNRVDSLIFLHDEWFMVGDAEVGFSAGEDGFRRGTLVWCEDYGVGGVLGRAIRVRKT